MYYTFSEPGWNNSRQIKKKEEISQDRFRFYFCCYYFYLDSCSLLQTVSKIFLTGFVVVLIHKGKAAAELIRGWCVLLNVWTQE